jgi:uncharacterized protein
LDNVAVPTYTLDDLKAFIGQDPEPVIGFYGGEPLLAQEYMYRVMDEVPAKAYTLQTNGTHLSEVEDRYLHRLHSILVSIDGPREVTDACRGEGTYDAVMRNLRDVRERGYSATWWPGWLTRTTATSTETRRTC